METSNYKDARFLIVDDELANVHLLEQTLESWGYLQVHSTTDPNQAVPLFCELQPDIVLLDLMMPGLDGYQVMQQLQPLIPTGNYIPIVVLTADTTVVARHKALALGAKDFLTKPFDMVELSLRVSNLVEIRSLHRQLQNQNQILEEKVQERTQQLANEELETIECLALAAEYRDDDTGQHTKRVGHFAALLAQFLGLSPDEVNSIRRAAPLHDVGKIGIPDHILLKPGRLTPEEFAVIKTHAAIGASILARHHTPLMQLAAVIAHSHHEKWDGSGYPQGLCGEDIPIEGRIVACADVFDALTHARPYKDAWPVEQAITEIESQCGRQFDPKVVKAFRWVQENLENDVADFAWVETN